MLQWILKTFRGRSHGNRDYLKSGGIIEAEHLCPVSERSDDLEISWESQSRPPPAWFESRGVYAFSRKALLLLILTEALLVALAYSAGRYSSRYAFMSFTPVPEMPQERLILSKDPIFSQPSSPEVDKAWASLLPTDRGMITIENPEHYHLPPGLLESDRGFTYGLTWTHQYHCLDMIRTEFWKLLRNESDLSGIEKSQNEHDQEMLYHKVHCFDYLRQTLMCSMDMTLESAAQDSETGESKGYINGWDIQHTCTDKQSVYDFMRKHAAQKGVR